MTAELLISVIIPTCDRENYAMDCVASILGQHYPAVELLVVDQSPTRRLEEMIAEKYSGACNIQYFHVERAGAARARNFAMKHALGAVVAFIDDDAVACPGWLHAIAEVFSASSRPALIGGRIHPIWEVERPAWYPPEREFLLGLYDIGDQPCPMPEHDLPIGANMAGWRETLMLQGGFEEQLGFNYFRKRQIIAGEETMLAERVRRSGYSIYYYPAALVKHRIPARKLSRQYFLRRHFWEGVTITQEMELLDQFRSGFASHVKYHALEIVMALCRFILPGYKRWYSHPNDVVRMLSLSRVAYSCGVIYGISELSKRRKAAKTSGA
jgi:glucosyl-dolichyl phosphate glucuronosyltransferase